MQITPQGYPLIATVEGEQRLVIGWTDRGGDAPALVPVTVPLSGPGEPQAHDDGEFEYTLAPQAT